MLVDFWASWCGPCRTFGPIFEAAAEKNPDIVFGKVDTEAEQQLAGAAGIPVWHGSGNDCGIVDASYVHSCAASANCTIPSDILSFLREDDLIVEPIRMVRTDAASGRGGRATNAAAGLLTATRTFYQ